MFAALLGGWEIVLILFLLPVFMGFWIWMLVHAILNKGLSDGETIGWVLAIVFLHFFGALLYCFIGRPKKNQTVGA